MMRDVTKALAARGHQVVIYASDYRKDQAFLDSMPANIDIRLLPCRSNLFNFCYMPSLRREARLHLREFDIIHLQTYRSYQNIILSREARLQNVPYILESHGTLPRTTGGKRSAVWALKHLFDTATGMKVLHQADRVIAHSDASIEEYVKFGVEREKVVLLLPPFDMTEFDGIPPGGSFRERYGIHDKKIILSLGRIHKIKGLDFLADSFARLCTTRDDVVLVIAGNDDGYLAKLRAHVHRAGIMDKVIFTGFVQGPAKLAALNDADVLVQPSLYEYNSRVMYEAILCGTPVVVSSGTMSSENLVKMDAGYLFEPGNCEQAAMMINRVIDDPGQMKEKVQKAASYIRAELSLQRGAEKYERLYREVIGSTHR